MASDRWTWTVDTKRYRDETTGRFLPAQRVIAARDAFIAGVRQQQTDLISLLATRSMNLQQWVITMRETTLRVHTAEYLAGRGGRNAMTQSDWGSLGALVKSQYQYIDGFARDMAAGNLTVPQAEARAAKYADSAVTSFERGRSTAWGMPDLPAYPGDGGTPCMSSCHCHWSYSETQTEWRARWILGSVASEHCDGCRTRAADYDPYVVPKPDSRSVPTPLRQAS